MEASERDDRARLLALVALVRRLFDLLLRPEHDGWILSHENYQLLSRAYGELIREGRFEAVEEFIRSPEAGPALAEQGLTGAKLELETALAESTTVEAERIADQRRASSKKVGRIAQLALKVANVALGSLGNVFPPAGIIQEVKDGAEAAVDIGAPFRQRVRARLRRVLRRPGKPPDIDSPPERERAPVGR